MSQMLEELIRGGFFKQPNNRRLEDVIKALETKGLSTEGKEDKISNALDRRAKKGVLKKDNISNRWISWLARARERVLISLKYVLKICVSCDIHGGKGVRLACSGRSKGLENRKI